MKLKSVKIKNYKCISKEVIFDTNDNLTCIVGKNETGKSSILESLATVKNFFPKENLLSQREYPLSKNNFSEDRSLVSCKFILTEQDIFEMASIFGINIAIENSVTFSRYYDNKTYIDQDKLLNEEKYVSEIKNKLNIIDDLINNFQLLANYLDINMNDDSSEQNFIKNIIDNSSNTFYSFINEQVKKMLPNFLYLNDNYLLKDKYSIGSILRNMASDRPPKDEFLLRNILESNCGDIKLFLNADEKVRSKKISCLKQVSRKINFELSQLEDIGRKLEVDIKDQNSQLNGNLDTEIHISISDSSNISVELGLRSNGIKYFVSLVAWLALVKDKNVILLLDEPGIGLHGSAQFELLEVIRKLNVQTIYTTHSPFMIDKYELNNIVTLEKNENGEIIVSDRIIDRDHKSCMPLLAALGYSLNQGLFFSDYYIVVEGFSDLCYFNIMNKYLGHPLDKRWQIIPAGSDTKISPLLKLLESNKLNAIVVCDKSPVGQVIESLKTEHNNTPMIQFNSIVEKKYADVEDLLDISNYIHIVKVINNIDDEIIENYEGISVKNICNIIKNKFPNANQDHDKIAKYIHEQGFDNIGFPEPKNIIENYTKLFNSINDTLANFDKQQKN